MTGNVNVPKITAPTKQVYRPPTQTQPYQADSYNYTPNQYTATPLNGPVSVAKPQTSPYGPILMDKPVQGYKTPARTVDYSYQSQYTPGRTLPSPKWATPVYTVPHGLGRLFPGLQPPSFDENGNMVTAAEARSLPGFLGGKSPISYDASGNPVAT